VPANSRGGCVPRFHLRPVLEATVGPLNGISPHEGPSMERSCTARRATHPSNPQSRAESCVYIAPWPSPCENESYYAVSPTTRKPLPMLVVPSTG
jgi:hypothetical protein